MTDRTDGQLSTDDVPAIRADGLDARYGKTWALRNCSFTVPRGAVTMLAGPNGAGKSTLLSVAAGITVPASGRLSIFGAEVNAGMNPRAAFVSQPRPLPAGLTVREVLRMGRSLNGDRWAPAKFVTRLLEDAGVPQGAKTGTLSDGARSLVAITLALARQPDVLLLDEPLAALDPLARDEVLRILMAEVAERAMTVLMSSHVPGELREVCDHLILLSAGQISLAGRIDDLIGEHRVLIGPAAAQPPISTDTVVHRGGTERQTALLVRGHTDQAPGWDSEAASLDTLILGYLRTARGRPQTDGRGGARH
jgi:ABC-2 type transport system ATP-binding protein